MKKRIGSMVDTALADLIKISNAVGKDTLLVQGGGGNTSVKTADGKYMYIKASGTLLKDMDAQTGWRRMNIDAYTLSVIPTSRGYKFKCPMAPGRLRIINCLGKTVYSAEVTKGSAVIINRRTVGSGLFYGVWDNGVRRVFSRVNVIY